MSTLAPITPLRIAVVGTTGTGKTTFSRRVAETIGAPHVELDALFHEPNWTPAAPDVFRARVSERIAARSWVTDGNYSSVLRDLIWSAADLIVWLDYPFRTVIWRLFLRTMRRGLRREELWNGNRSPSVRTSSAVSRSSSGRGRRIGSTAATGLPHSPRPRWRTFRWSAFARLAAP